MSDLEYEGKAQIAAHLFFCLHCNFHFGVFVDVEDKLEYRIVHCPVCGKGELVRSEVPRQEFRASIL